MSHAIFSQAPIRRHQPVTIFAPFSATRRSSAQGAPS
jgi:hypothetical protein